MPIPMPRPTWTAMPRAWAFPPSCAHEQQPDPGRVMPAIGRKRYFPVRAMNCPDRMDASGMPAIKGSRCRPEVSGLSPLTAWRNRAGKRPRRTSQTRWPGRRRKSPRRCAWRTSPAAGSVRTPCARRTGRGQRRPSRTRPGPRSKAKARSRRYWRGRSEEQRQRVQCPATLPEEVNRPAFARSRRGQALLQARSWRPCPRGC